MYLSLLFWLALVLPGYVIVRKLYKDDLDCGLFGTLGLCYLAVFGLLSPVSILCYVLELPLAVLSTACILAIIAAPVVISRRGWWPEVGRLLLTGLTLEFLIVAIDMAMGARVGGYVTGDAYAHLGRIRFLVNHGISNLDPYVTAECFYPTYHTNLLHSLMAACSQVTQLDPTSVWFASLAWIKLFIASGVYYLAWVVFGRRWPAWIAAMFFIGERGFSPLVIYPNQLAPSWLFPFIVAFAIQACRGAGGWRTCLKLGVASLVIGQIHGLYILFAAIALVPTLLVATLVRLRTGWRRALWPAVCLPAVMIGLVFPAVSRSMNPLFQAGIKKDAAAANQIDNRKDAAQKMPPRKEHAAYVYHDDGSVGLKLGWGWAGARITAASIPKWIPRWIRIVIWKVCVYHRHALIVGGLCLALWSRRRWHAAPLVGVFATIGVVLYYPPACTLLFRQFREPWILTRMPFLIGILMYAIGLPAIAYWVEQRFRVRWWMRSAVSIALILFVITRYCPQKGQFTWESYYTKAIAPEDKRAGEYRFMRQVHEFLKNRLPPNETILTPADYGMLVASVYDCRLVVAASSSEGVPDRGQRMRDLKRMLHNATPWPQRSALLRKYGIEYYLPTKTAAPWVKGHIREVRRMKRGISIVRLRIDKE